MSGELLNDGRPLVVESESDRIGRGPWARLLAAAAVQDEGSSTAERGRALARGGAVHTVGVARGELSGLVAGDDGEHTATIAADPVPPRIWSAMVRAARGNGPLEAAVEGRQQSMQLEHLMTVDWEEPLVPPARALRRSCTCPATGACEHLAALAYVAADVIDRDPSLLLRFRGCQEVEDEAPRPAVVRPDPGVDPWQARPLPPLLPPRPLPVGSVLKRLGSSGIRAHGHDLAEILQRAYTAFARERPDS
jgi:hypothetical protein